MVKCLTRVWFVEVAASSGRADREETDRDSERAGEIWQWTPTWCSGETRFPHWCEFTSWHLHNIAPRFELLKKMCPFEPVIFQRVTAFTQDAISLTTGEELKYGGRLNIFAILRREFAAWQDVIERSGVTCKCFNNLIVHHFHCLCCGFWQQNCNLVCKLFSKIVKCYLSSLKYFCLATWTRDGFLVYPASERWLCQKWMQCMLVVESS